MACPSRSRRVSSSTEGALRISLLVEAATSGQLSRVVFLPERRQCFACWGDRPTRFFGQSRSNSVRSLFFYFLENNNHDFSERKGGSARLGN